MEIKWPSLRRHTIICDEVCYKGGLCNCGAFEANKMLASCKAAVEKFGQPSQAVNEELLKDWLKFSKDVMPSDAAGTDWLDELIKRTKDELAKATAAKEGK